SGASPASTGPYPPLASREALAYFNLSMTLVTRRRPFLAINVLDPSALIARAPGRRCRHAHPRLPFTPSPLHFLHPAAACTPRNLPPRQRRTTQRRPQRARPRRYDAGAPHDVPVDGGRADGGDPSPGDGPPLDLQRQPHAAIARHPGARGRAAPG